MAMEAVPFIGSSNIRSAQYDSATQELVISFIGGGTYSYAQVPQSVVDGFSAAPSAGSYLHAAIKGKFAATKL